MLETTTDPEGWLMKEEAQPPLAQTQLGVVDARQAEHEKYCAQLGHEPRSVTRTGQELAVFCRTQESLHQPHEASNVQASHEV